VVGRELDDLGRAVVDEDAPVPVDDLAARGRGDDRANAVVVGLCQVVVARQHLQVPEAEEDDREHDERNAAEDGDAQREPRAHGGATPVGIEIHQPIAVKSRGP